MGTTDAHSPLKKHSYFGWKVLINFRVVSESLAIRPSEVDTLLHLAAACDLYFLTQVEQDAEEEAVREACRACGLFDAGLLPCKVLFCSTQKGKEAISRQLMPAIFMDSEFATIQYLAAHLPHIAMIDRTLATPTLAAIPSSGPAATDGAATSSSASASSSTSSSCPAGAPASAEASLPPCRAHPMYPNILVSPSVSYFFRTLSA
eukprot:NODE_2904_length_727_cov_206.603245_g2047_i0.p1 GENE.NODE_2904_length_727_cov_206.603245_g2047_i0~~NODE_2904_length_727_cov_206.603245_g2047_i0.p1  ORF type:complete len:212 (-),score=86.15 NODE_2904_length_727_cov_206.603245_g2047_i0:90-704(-)